MFGTFYGRFEKVFSSIYSPFKTFTWEKVNFLWFETCGKSFQELRDRLTLTPILALPKEFGRFCGVLWCFIDWSWLCSNAPWKIYWLQFKAIGDAWEKLSYSIRISNTSVCSKKFKDITCMVFMWMCLLTTKEMTWVIVRLWHDNILLPSKANMVVDALTWLAMRSLAHIVYDKK